MVWWLIVISGALALGVCAAQEGSTVWRTAALGLLAGVVLYAVEVGPLWLMLVRSLAVGALIGVAYELLSELFSTRDAG